ncbi:fimbrial biogenesis outer membrane usher protein [Caulobacter sp. KR2-114]|uniref:fimbrial biogenesis outer membrane usher protein n=1 Tax=Caulobacter sp. KR2-114 TaxID=3400912 RepID=UPI003C018DAD
MRRNLHRTTSAELRLSRWLLASCAAVGFGGTALAQPGVTPQAQERTITVGQPTAPTNAPVRLNPTGRAINLTVPAKDGNVYLGDIVISIDTADHLSLSGQRIIDLLSNVIDAKRLETLRGAFAGKGVISPDDLTGAGLKVTYDPQNLELSLQIPSEWRASQNLQVSPLDRARFGAFEHPAKFSAYLNMRGSVDYVEKGGPTGFDAPNIFLDGAARFEKFAVESQGVWQPGAQGSDFQRTGSRLIYDDTKNVVRFTLGDLQPVTRADQSAPQMAGFSAFRSYSVLEPQNIVRPRGDRSFSLDRQSTVEVYVNGQLVRRVILDAGNYNLRDFPFTQGANDVRLSITDNTGRTQTLRFNIFFDQSQLGKGLSEFGFYAGVKAPLETDGPHYTKEWIVTGFYRRGITDNLTIGGNFQADSKTLLGGIEGVAATTIGTFGGGVSVSHLDGFGMGVATAFTFQRLIQRAGGQSDSLNFSLQTHSKNFAPVDTVLPDNPFSYEVGAGYSHAFNDFIYAGVDLRYSHGRGANHDVANYRGTVGWRLTSNISMTADLLWEDGPQGHDIAGLLSITARLGTYSNVRADYDSRGERARLSYQTLHGEGVGSYNLAADIERTNTDSGFNATANYITNRAELGVNQFSSFSGNFGASTDQRTSLRWGTAIAMADGAFSIGRPVYDSFAIVVPHKTLNGTDVIVDPTPQGYTANTGILHSAIEPNLSSYNERTVTVDAPKAPEGVDLGKGAFRLYPPYRAGYKLEVGSDYSITAIGRMVGEDGNPLSLISGKATELAHPDHEPLIIFTNREGRFGAAGLKAGRWRVEMLTEPASVYIIDIPASAVGVVKVGDLKPSTDGK